MNNNVSENDRAYRLSLRINEAHYLLTNIYENLVDRDFVTAEKDIRVIIIQMKLILKSMEDDDF